MSVFLAVSQVNGLLNNFSEADLSQHEPEFTLADLSDTTAVLQALNL